MNRASCDQQQSGDLPFTNIYDSVDLVPTPQPQSKWSVPFFGDNHCFCRISTIVCHFFHSCTNLY